MSGQRIDMAAEHRRLVLDILRAHLPPETRAWVFGSRAAGRAWLYSDLDLALDAGRKLSVDELAILAEALRESDLPYRVDLVDCRGIGDRFREVIAAERVALADGGNGEGAIAAAPTQQDSAEQDPLPLPSPACGRGKRSGEG